MDMLQLPEIKRDFDNGVVETTTLRYEPILGGYTLNFAYSSGRIEILSKQRDKNHPRIFKTSDAAMNVLRDIGLYEARLLFA